MKVDRPALNWQAISQSATGALHVINGTELNSMPEITPLDKMRLPFGGQEIEFQHLTHESGGVPFLRIRIRENKRFTIFDVDPVSARAWAELMGAWARDNAGDTP